MAADLKAKYGTSNQAITCSLAPAGVGLANNTARAATAVSNTSTLFLDFAVQIKIKTGASGVSATGYVNIYIAASVDGGTTYSDNATGTDAAITLTVPPNSKLIGTINAVANATTYPSALMSVAQAFNFIVPEFWVLIIENKTGAAFDTTEGNHAKFYQGIYGQST